MDQPGVFLCVALCSLCLCGEMFTVDADRSEGPYHRAQRTQSYTEGSIKIITSLKIPAQGPRDGFVLFHEAGEKIGGAGVFVFVGTFINIFAQQLYHGFMIFQ